MIVNFSRGELSPTMRYRSDLDAYHLGVEILERFLPTPRGGLEKGPGYQVLEHLPPSDRLPAVRMFTLGSTGLEDSVKAVGEGPTEEFGDTTYDTEDRVHDIPKDQELEILLAFTEHEDGDDIIAYWVNTPNGVPAYLQRVYNGEGFPEIDFDDTRDVRVVQVESSVYIIARSQIYRVFWEQNKDVDEWAGGTSYQLRDVVWREHNGTVKFFECIYAHTGLDPAGPSGSANWRMVYRPHISWEVVSPRVGYKLLNGIGTDDEPYEFIANRAWANGETYYKGDVVHETHYYECLKEHVASSPPTEGEYWAKLEVPEEDDVVTEDVMYLASTYAYREETIPREMIVHHNRLLFGGSSVRPSTLHGSKVGHYMTFGSGVKDGDPFVVTLSGDKVGRILWMAVTDQLYIGTSGGIFAVSGVLTPTEFQLRKVTSHAASPVHSVSASGSILFFHKDAKTLREIEYADQAENYRATDLTVYSTHLFEESRAIKMVVMNDPMIVVWILRENGTLVSLSYEKTVNMYAFARHNFPGVVMDIVAGRSNEMYAVVKVVVEVGGEEKEVLQLVRIGDRNITLGVDGTEHLMENVKLDGLYSFVNKDTSNEFALTVPNDSVRAWYEDNGVLSLPDLRNRTSAVVMTEVEGDIATGGFGFLESISALDLSGNALTGVVGDAWRQLMVNGANAALDISGTQIEAWALEEIPTSWKSINISYTSIPVEHIEILLDAIIEADTSNGSLDIRGLGVVDVSLGLSKIVTLLGKGWTVYLDNQAEWENDMVSFSANGGSGTTTSIPCLLGGSVVLPESGYSKVNANFVGWRYGDASYFPGDPFIKSDEGNVTLEAMWIANNAVIYQGKGGSGSPIDGNTYDEGQMVAIKSGTPVRTGHSFLGWTLDDSGLGTVYKAGDKVPMPATELVLYAKWKVNQYQVKYMTNFATHGSVPASITVNYGESFTVEAPNNLHREAGSMGGKFVSWNTNMAGLGTTYRAGSTYTMPAQNLTLYAQFGPYQVGDRGPYGWIVHDFGSYQERGFALFGYNDVFGHLNYNTYNTKKVYCRFVEAHPDNFGPRNHTCGPGNVPAYSGPWNYFGVNWYEDWNDSFHSQNAGNVNKNLKYWAIGFNTPAFSKRRYHFWYWSGSGWKKDSTTDRTKPYYLRIIRGL